MRWGRVFVVYVLEEYAGQQRWLESGNQYVAKQHSRSTQQCQLVNVPVLCTYYIMSTRRFIVVGMSCRKWKVVGTRCRKWHLRLPAPRANCQVLQGSSVMSSTECPRN